MRYRLAALLAPLALWSGFAAAADLAMSPPPPAGTSDTYIVTLTANGRIVPNFPGSDSLTGVVYPALSFRRSDEPARFSAPDDGISISFLDTPSFRIGPVARVDTGRFLSDDHELFGLRKIPFDIEAGAFVEYWPLDFVRTRIELRHGTTDGIGFVGNAGIDFIKSYQKFTFSLGPRLTFGDDDYVRVYFGVKPFESTLNGRLPAYRPNGGLTSAGVLGAATYAWNETWATTGYVGYNRLIGDASDSPLPRRIGSENQLSLGLSVSYSFAYKP